MKNFEIRETAARAGVKLWEVADALGVADSTFSRKMRHELSDEERSQVLRIIDELSGGVHGG